MKTGEIHVYPFNGRKLHTSTFSQPQASIQADGERSVILLNITSPALQEHIERLWEPKQEKGWKNSWIPLITDAIFTQNNVFLNLGAMTYAQTNGCLDAIKNKYFNAPELGFLNNLSVGVLPVTSDGYVPLSRRSNDMPHCPGYWNHPCGYMTSLHIGRNNCDDPSHLENPLLFYPRGQLLQRIFNQEFEGLKVDEIEVGEPNFLGTGWLTLEMYVSSVGKLKLDKQATQERIKMYRVEGAGATEHNEVRFIPINRLGELLLRQKYLLGVDAVNHIPQNDVDIPILDETILAILYGHEQIGANIGGTDKMINKLNMDFMGDRLDIRVVPTGGQKTGKWFKFPTHY